MTEFTVRAQSRGTIVPRLFLFVVVAALTLPIRTAPSC